MAVGSSREKAAGKLSRLLGRACWRQKNQGIAPIGCLCLCCALPKTRSARSRASPAQNRFLPLPPVNETRDRQAPSGPGICRCIPLTKGYMVKLYRDSGHLENVSRAVTRAHALGIRTPTIKRSVRAEDGYFECIQARVHGPTLMEIWPHLGIVSSFRLAFQLRSMVGRMRTLTRPTAGSLGTGICRSI